MHGVKRRVKTNDEIEAERKREELKRIEKFCSVSQAVLEKRNANEYSQEALELTGKALDMNYEFYTLWNYRREIFEHLAQQLPEEEIEKLYTNELKFLEGAIAANPKSYWSWLHRTWITGKMKNCNWQRELQLCSKLLSLDERNFHCWSYRRYAASKSNTTLDQEFSFTTTKVSDNFSNYSAWHQRSALLTEKYKSDSIGFQKALEEEFDLIRNALYTDPNDQSAWFYHRWLIDHCENIKTEQIMSTELSMCDELLSLEPNSKWPLLTKHFLLTIQGSNQEECNRILSTLIRIDPLRSGYYRDFMSGSEHPAAIQHLRDAVQNTTTEQNIEQKM